MTASASRAEDAIGTVIVPAYNAVDFLRVILPPLQALGERWEKIIVDDGSSDETVKVARALIPDAIILCNESPKGPAAARNRAACHASGDILIFLDSDVVVAASTIRALKDYLERNPDVTGVFGCYNQCDQCSSLVADFRNLLHRFVHNQSHGKVDSFWSGLGAIRKDVFLRCGGFRTDLFRHPSIEDVELGKRLSEMGYTIRLEPGFEGRHLKRWTLRSMIRTDILQRALPWADLLLQGNAPSGSLNLAPRMLAAPALLALSLLSLLLLKPLLTVFLLALYLGSNLAIYRFMARKSMKLGAASVTHLTIHHLCCLTGGVLGACRFVQHTFRPRGLRAPHLPLEKQPALARPQAQDHLQALKS